MRFPVALYRLTVTRQRSATLFRFFADTDEEAMGRAARMIAADGTGAVGASLTRDGRVIGGRGPTTILDRPSGRRG